MANTHSNMKSANVGIGFSGQYSVERLESRRLRNIRRASASRHGDLPRFRAIHGREFNGGETDFLLLNPITRALVERDIVADITARPEAWQHPEVVEVRESRPVCSNLILDQGKNAWFTGATRINNFNLYCAAGTGTATPAVTDTGLGSELSRTGTMLTGAGNCGTSFGATSLTSRRTHDFPVEVANRNYTELIWSHAPEAAANANIRVLISGGTVTVLIGQQLRVVHDLTVNMGPTTEQTETLSITGWPIAPATDVAVHWQWQDIGFTGTDEDGGAGTGGNIEPGGGYGGWMSVVYTGMTLSAWKTVPTLSGRQSVGDYGTEAGAGGWGTYTPNSFTRSLSFGYIQAGLWSSSAIRGYAMHRFTSNGYGVSVGACVIAVRFDQLQTKDNLHKLRLPGFTISLSS